MPTVNVFKSQINEKLGQITEDEFREICFDFGIELDEVTSEYLMVSKEQGLAKAENCSQSIIYKIDVPANRCDLLCVEGLLRALMIYQKRIKTPIYVCNPKVATIKMSMTSATQSVRPYVVAAVLRNITFTKERYESFIALQDKLHQNIGRKRSVVSIGTHDLDTLEPPFIYDAKRPRDIKFVPLNESKEFTAEELMVHYSNESHLKPYLPIIRDFDIYPIIYDCRGVILSLPPIINGDHSKIKLSTKNVLIEITATNLHKASVSLDTIVTMFSEYCSPSFQVEPVEIVRPDGSSHQYPELSYRMESVSVDYINKSVGIAISTDEMASLLSKMGLRADASGSVLSVEIPPTRHDILHRCDIMEDVAIAYGYNNIARNCNHSSSSAFPDGGWQKISKVTYDLRIQMCFEGFTEALSFALCSKEDISTKLGVNIGDAVHIANPKSQEFQVARTTLLPGLLNTIYNNQHLPLPLNLFEVQDVVVKDALANGTNEVGARNERRLCAVQYDMLPDDDAILNVLYGVMASQGFRYERSGSVVVAGDCTDTGHVYSLEEDHGNETLWPGRSYAVRVSSGKRIGAVGIVRPPAVKNFKIKKGFVTMFEIDIGQFLCG